MFFFYCPPCCMYQLPCVRAKGMHYIMLLWLLYCHSCRITLAHTHFHVWRPRVHSMVSWVGEQSLHAHQLLPSTTRSQWHLACNGQWHIACNGQWYLVCNGQWHPVCNGTINYSGSSSLYSLSREPIKGVGRTTVAPRPSMCTLRTCMGVSQHGLNTV